MRLTPSYLLIHTPAVWKEFIWQEIEKENAMRSESRRPSLIFQGIIHLMVLLSIVSLLRFLIRPVSPCIPLTVRRERIRDEGTEGKR